MSFHSLNWHHKTHSILKQTFKNQLHIEYNNNKNYNNSLKECKKRERKIFQQFKNFFWYFKKQTKYVTKKMKNIVIITAKCYVSTIFIVGFFYILL